MQPENEYQILTKLGLTVNQARAYLMLVKLGPATAQELAESSKITRQDVYRVTAELQKLGLIEKELTTPAIFKAMSVKECIFILLQQRAAQTAELREEACSLIWDLNGNNGNGKKHIEKAQFVLIPEGKMPTSKTKTLIENAEKNIHIVVSLKRLLSTIYDWLELYREIAKRKVNIQIITEKPENEKMLLTELTKIQKNPFVKVRYSPIPVVNFEVYDNKQILLKTSGETSSQGDRALWSNDTGLLELAQNYFETTWKMSEKLQPNTYSNSNHIRTLATHKI